MELRCKWVVAVANGIVAVADGFVALGNGIVSIAERSLIQRQVQGIKRRSDVLRCGTHSMQSITKNAVNFFVKFCQFPRPRPAGGPAHSYGGAINGNGAS